MTVLVIDDDETITTLVKKTLENADITVITASSGKEGLNIIKTMPPNAIVLDRKMPEMDGDEVLQQLKSNEQTRDIPVLMLTSKNAITDVSECLEMGASDYIVKPFDHSNLIVRVKNILR